MSLDDLTDRLLRFTLGERNAVVARTRDGWSFGGNAFEDLRVMAHAVTAALGAEAAYGLVIPFSGTDVFGRIRDGGGPRESYIIDVETGDSSTGLSAPTIEEAVLVLLEALESGQLPDSW
jgi:hypothetical protein